MNAIRLLASGLLTSIGLLCPMTSGLASDSQPWQWVVMDPLAAPLSCACVSGTGQRRYDELGKYLEQLAGRRFEITFDESLELARPRMTSDIDLVIGKHSVVVFDAQRLGIQLRPIAALTDQGGHSRLTGQVVVRTVDGPRSLDELKRRTIALGPEDSAEVHAAAIELLLRHGSRDEWTLKTYKSIDAAVFAVADGEADAALISDYLLPLLEGCGKIERHSLKVIAATNPVPFITLFAASHVSEAEVVVIQDALKKVSKEGPLLLKLESKQGFTIAAEFETSLWTDWRGRKRAGFSDSLPEQLLKQEILWSAPLTGPAMAGIAATEEFIIVADKSADLTSDIFRCLDAATGQPRWTVEYTANQPLDYTNAPRANPLIADQLVYLTGALGDLHCVELSTGKIVWKLNIVEGFDTKLLSWGQCSPPLLMDGRLIINPGAKQASLVALDAKTGQVVWKTPGHAAAYGAMIDATLGGRRQIIGYDSSSLGGWDPQDGRRLWTLIPPGASDFNVTTPVVTDEKLLLATENNATRLYVFDENGCIVPDPIAENQDFAPDTCTPVVVDGRVFGTAYGELFCLEIRDGLKTRWSIANDMFYDHANLIAGRDRILVWTTTCDLLLLSALAEHYELVSHLRPFPEETAESMSHPAIVGNRLYLRDKTRIICLPLK